MSVKEIKSGDHILAKLITSDEWKEGLNFYSNDNDYIQIGTWEYNSGKVLLAHSHNEFERKVYKTQEVLFIKKGKLLVEIYDINDKLAAEFLASEGDIVVLLNGGHGYKIAEDGTQVLEIKNGPYTGPAIDRRRL